MPRTSQKSWPPARAQHEALGRVVSSAGPFSVAARLLTNHAAALTVFGLARADADVTGESAQVTSGSAWTFGSDARRRYRGMFADYGRRYSAGDVVTVHWSAGHVSFALNGEDLGVAFAGVPLPLRAYAHCGEGVAWDLSVAEGLGASGEPGLWGSSVEGRGVRKRESGQVRVLRHCDLLGEAGPEVPPGAAKVGKSMSCSSAFRNDRHFQFGRNSGTVGFSGLRRLGSVIARAVSARHADWTQFRPIPRKDTPFRNDLSLGRPLSGDFPKASHAPKSRIGIRSPSRSASRI